MREMKAEQGLNIQVGYAVRAFPIILHSFGKTYSILKTVYYLLSKLIDKRTHIR